MFVAYQSTRLHIVKTQTVFLIENVVTFPDILDPKFRCNSIKVKFKNIDLYRPQNIVKH